MNPTIHRVDFPITDRVDMQLPGYRRAIHVAEHRHTPGALEVWYETVINDAEPPTAVTFTVHGTGNPIWHRTGPGWADHIGTVVARDGLVWHVYSQLTALIGHNQ